MKQESLYIQDGEHQLHLRHIYQNLGGTPVLMIHGAVENGRIFYTEKGKGLACYLAEQGFDVYVADLRGRGKSRPAIQADASYGQYEAITRDIPLFIDFIADKTQQKIHLISHSWGGVLIASTLSRFPHYLEKVYSNVCFGTKRSVKINNLAKFIKVKLFWNTFAVRLTQRKGFLNAKKYKLGSDNETIQSVSHSVAWVKKGHWIDPQDDYDYFASAQLIKWPPTWHLTGVKDNVLGQAGDVLNFIEETANDQAKFTLLAIKNGNLVDYDHIDILTHPKAVIDHFPEIACWLKEVQKKLLNSRLER
ncbi:alpha/beta fold hydrolase [Colwelliaceae bacterium 6471]